MGDLRKPKHQPAISIKAEPDPWDDWAPAGPPLAAIYVPTHVDDLAALNSESAVSRADRRAAQSRRNKR